MTFEEMMISIMSPRTALRFIRFWPPYLGAGISVESVNSDFTDITVKMPLTKLNSNFVGSHFGGSLYSMCDPFFMLILIQHLKEEHIVWDQSAKIEFKKPGKGTVRAHFNISLEKISELKEQALNEYSLKPVFSCRVLDEKDDVVAVVEKQLYIRRKDAKERFKK